MKVHEIKCDVANFIPLVVRCKTFEIRKNDRDYSFGDHAYLKEWNGRGFSGRWILAEIKYVTDFHQEPGYVVFGIVELARGGFVQ